MSLAKGALLFDVSFTIPDVRCCVEIEFVGAGGDVVYVRW
jgi:hypothetical protein